MTNSGVAGKAELDAAIAVFDGYALDVRKRYEAILLSENREKNLAELAADERAQVENYGRLVEKIDQLMRKHIRNAIVVNPPPSESNLLAVNKQVTFRLQRSHSFDELLEKNAAHNEPTVNKQAPYKKRSQ